jgi:hypothetical protein
MLGFKSEGSARRFLTNYDGLQYLYTQRHLMAEELSSGSEVKPSTLHL